MDDSDFKAMAPRGITKEKFASLELNSKIRESVCDSRKLWRLIKEGKADSCDLYWHYKHMAVAYFDSHSEVNALQKAMDAIPVVSEPWKNCR